MSISEPAHERGDLMIAVVADIDEVLERRLQPTPHRRIVVLPERQCGDLETRLVVAFEQAGRQISRRMLVEVGREIGDAKAIMGIDLALPERPIGRLLLHVTPGALQLLGGRRGNGDDGVRQAQRFFGPDHGQKLSRLRRQIRPVANAQF